MKILAAFVFALFVPVAALAANADTEKATDTANTWLGMVDANNYAQSWNTASSLLQSQVTEAQWEAAGKAARGPFGPVVARNLAGVDFATTLPGAPDGQYAVLRFNTKFANKAAAIETIALVMDGGAWKVSGYHLK